MAETRKWPVITGSVVLVLGAAVLALWVARPDDPSVVVYEVFGEVRSATVTYSTFDEGNPTHREELTAFPWQKKLLVEGDVIGGVLTVTIGPDGGSVACRVGVNGEERRAATATGPLTSALCSNF
ncbi:MmpS family transport accessory protein [Saccharothrix obliqua]|uniref:MmpS family transport accessory protein n=1 Tax=Saccharothrix obliqua TaxID=2861747 RepID=UPI001C5E5561|nr:MmpS family transport accessory protein [Saccharothrix obliqua]MBW4715927.1 MmpS family protein [Saccharothrix obliqua]